VLALRALDSHARDEGVVACGLHLLKEKLAQEQGAAALAAAKRVDYVARLQGGAGIANIMGKVIVGLAARGQWRLRDSLALANACSAMLALAKPGKFGSFAHVKDLVATLNDRPALANASLLAAGLARPGDAPDLAPVEAVKAAVKDATSPGEVGPALKLLC
jgi:hypothetical protein